MKLAHLHAQPEGHPPDEALVEWVRNRCGYQVFCGKDRTVSRLTIHGENIGVTRWPALEMPERADDPEVSHQDLSPEQFFEMSKPTTLLINPRLKLVAYLPPLRERGEYDRRHRLGYQWLDKHVHGSATGWFSFQQAHQGFQTYVREDLQQWKSAARVAIDLNFLPPDAEIMILDGGACQKAPIQDIFSSKDLSTISSGLTPAALSLAKAVERIYQAESRMHRNNGAFSLHDSVRAEDDLIKEILDLRSKLSAIVPLSDDGTLDKQKAMFQNMDPISVVRCTRAFKKAFNHLQQAENHAYQGKAGLAVASFSFFKQVLHEMMRDFPGETAIIFGDTRIETIFASLSEK